MSRKGSEIAAIIAATIMASPSSKKQICTALGLSEHRTDNINHFIEAYKAQGVIYICGYTKWRWPVYAWNQKPWENNDVPKPLDRAATKAMVLEMRKALETVPMTRHRYIGALGPNSVFALGAQ